MRRPPRSTLFPTRRSSDLRTGVLLQSLGGYMLCKMQMTLDKSWQKRPAPSLWPPLAPAPCPNDGDRKSTRLNSSHSQISYAVFCLKQKKASSGLRTLGVGV